MRTEIETTPETENAKVVDAEIENDSDMMKLLAVLRTIPEAEIPSGFQQRLNLALKEEGEKIRKENIGTKWNVRKWNIKTIAAIAACFVVVFASVAVYNNEIGRFTGFDSAEESAGLMAATDGAGDESTANEKEKTENNIDIMDAGTAPSESDQTDALAGGENNSYIRYGLASGSKDLYKQDDSLIMQSAAPDMLCREGGNLPRATDESLSYRKMIDDHLSGYEFEHTSCEMDPETGAYLFTVLIISDPEGQAVNSPVIFMGMQGEIYEQQQGEQPGEEPSERREEQSGEEPEERRGEQPGEQQEEQKPEEQKIGGD